MDYNKLLYSLDNKLGIKDIKSGNYKKNIDISKIKKWTNENEINCIQCGEENYHFKFETIKSKPYFVYYKGNIDLLNKPILSIVGPRNMSTYAEKVLNKLFTSLKEYNCATISGLADGVDNLCHSLSIKNKIPTIAVLGGGIGWFLQSKKRNIINTIIENGGLILSEFKLKQEPTNYTFPQRNRIIAGLSKSLFVPEASKNSGTLITVNNAIDMKIPTYATSNGFFEKNSLGINKLIGDKKINLVYDFEQYLGTFFQKNKKIPSDLASTYDSLYSKKFSILQTKILKFITKHKEIDNENIQDSLNIDSKTLFTELSLLEIEGVICQSSPGRYSIT